MSEHDSRRRHHRIETQQQVWVEGQDVRVSAQAKNISKGGMFVVAEGDAPGVGTVLQVQFEDPHEGVIDVKMEVVWRDEKTLTANLGLRAVDSRGMEAFERVVTRYEATLPSLVGGLKPASKAPSSSPAARPARPSDPSGQESK
jgi:c-di-GMP-binding flagellar brake protein YcgR